MPPVMELDSSNTSRNRRPEQGADSFSRDIIIRPHEGYRKYFEGSLRPDDIPMLFNEQDTTSQFPSVQYAAGWTYADYAISSRKLSIDNRLNYIDEAKQHWEDAVDLTAKTYDLLPGRVLLWPCTKWRYQFAIDTVPTLQAIAHFREERGRAFDSSLIEESRTNINATIQKLMGKYAWTLNHYSEEDHDPITRDQLRGKLGAIAGVALEGAAVSAAQWAGEDAYAVLPPSLRLDTGRGAKAVDIVALSTRNVTFSAQIKKNVTNEDRKKYRDVALLCGKHHLSNYGEAVMDVVELIGEDTDRDRIKDLGNVALNVMKGSRKYGCSQFNPRPAHTLNHRRRRAA